MRRFRTIVAIAVSTLLFVSICLAQQTSTTSVPNLIRYGGVLKDAQGVALSSSSAVGVTFAIYKQQDGGAPVWMETQNVTPDANGQYSVMLGSTTATGLPSDLFSQEEQRWLGVQVQGQPEQPRVLLVSVPYAFKAHEAETLAGKSISDFVLAKDLNSPNSAAGTASSAGFGSTQAASGKGSNQAPSKLAASAGPTNFSGSTTDQIVKVTQSGTGAGVNASAASNAILGTATAATGTAFAIEGVATGTGGRGIFGYANSATGSTIGMEGAANSTSGVGLWGTATATSGPTVGVFSSVASPSGTAAVYNNVAGGKLLSGRNNGVEKFSVDGSGNVNALGGFIGSGAGLTGIQFSQLSGTLASSQFSGTYSNAVTLSNTSNVYYGNGSNLTGVIAGPGSPYYIQNGTSQQASASFNISGNGSAGGTLSGNAVNSTTGYQIGGTGVLSIGTGASSNNLFLGVGAGANPAGGPQNTFSGAYAGYGNTGFSNTFTGVYAGYSNTNGSENTFSGAYAGYYSTYAYHNTFSGYQAGYSNTSGGPNSFYGDEAGRSNSTGSYNTVFRLPCRIQQHRR